MGKSRKDLNRAYLIEQIEMAKKAREALLHSYNGILPKAPWSQPLSLELAEKLEALAARFARLADILTQKIFRTVDALELEEEGSLIDRLNRMEKRGVIASAVYWEEIQELRNQIAHEYVLESLDPLYRAVISHCPEVLGAVEKVEQRVKQKNLI